MLILYQLHKSYYCHIAIPLYCYNITLTYIEWLIIYILISQFIYYYYTSSIHTLILSILIILILLLLHYCITDRYTSSIHVLILSQLYQSCHRRIIMLYYIAIPLYCYTIAPTYVKWLVIDTFISQFIVSHFYISQYGSIYLGHIA